MARLHDHNDPRSEVPDAQGRCPSIYAAFTLARLVHSFISRVKSNLHSRQRSNKPWLGVSALGSYSFPVHSNLSKYGIGRTDHSSPTTSSKQSGPQQHVSSNIDGHCVWRRGLTSRSSTRELLRKLDVSTKPQEVSTAKVATEDKLFLQYDAQPALASKEAKGLGSVLDLTTLLILRLQKFSGSQCTNSLGTLSEALSSFDLQCEKGLANLVHMLRCLQQAALEALIQISLKRLEGDLIAWYLYWRQRRHTSASWFSEWSSSRRPLSTTWPWNIKPSLNILWGVCWMFYADGESTRTPGQAEGFPFTFWTGHPPQPPQATASATVPQATEAWDANTFNVAINPSRSGLQGENHSRYPSHASERDNRSTDYYTLPASSFSASSSPYISASPSTSPALFATPLQFRPHYQGNNGSSIFTYDPGYNFAIDQQRLPESLATQTPLISDIETATAVYPYVQQPTHALPYEGSRDMGRPGAATISSFHGLANRSGLAPSNMPDYPSPRSDMSGLSRSPSLSLYPTADTSTTTVPYTTVPSSRRSSTYGSPQSVKSEEPSRNDKGLIYCTHKECLSDPPIFTRKCEWTKHNDKHNRPYVCEERGCEKILGFTYSGGLLRHQREVHKQHGGPKARCVCPHKDCKRSTGTGFSRRENLVEHLRRVHRGVEEVGGDQVATPTPTAGQGRKRRREPSDEGAEEEVHQPPETGKRRKLIKGADESNAKDPPADTTDDVGEPEDLRVQIKSLQHELQQKDERLRKLEETVARLAGSQPSDSSIRARDLEPVS